MKLLKKSFSLLATSLVGVGFYACSASKTEQGESPFGQNLGGSANGTGRDGSLGNSGFGNNQTGAGGGGIIFGASGGAAGHRNNNAADACPAIHQKPETVVVYHDASVTDTIYTSKPVALFIMQDRSSSMVGVTGDPNSWPNSTTAITAFVNDPKTAGIDIALGVFPPMNIADPVVQGDCAGGTDCGTQVVPWGPLPANGPAMIQGYNTANPSGGTCPIVCLTPTECALRGMINNCLQFMAASPSGEQCVAILVTDGAPTTCNLDHPTLVKIVADGHTAGITTYTLGLPGADINFLNELSNAGGTGQSIDLTSGNAQAFIDALNNIRQTIAVTTTQQVTTSTVISTPLPCEWKIPPVAPPATFDKTKVNVQFVPPGAPAVDFGNVPNAAACAGVTQDAWYYDNNDNPTRVLACPNACNGTLHNSPGAEVDIIFGCETHIIFH